MQQKLPAGAYITIALLLGLVMLLTWLVASYPDQPIQISVPDYTEQLARFTKYLFWATVVLGVVGLFQAIQLYRTVSAMQTTEWRQLRAYISDRPHNLKTIEEWR